MKKYTKKIKTLSQIQQEIVLSSERISSALL